MRFDEDAAKALEVIYATRDRRRPRDLVHEGLGAKTGERVLDLGCGPGFYVAELLERVGATGHVAGVDTSSPMLALAAQRIGARDNVELAEAPVTVLPFDDASFDAAISVQVLEYVEDVDRALVELHRV